MPSVTFWTLIYIILNINFFLCFNSSYSARCSKDVERPAVCKGIEPEEAVFSDGLKIERIHY